MSLPSSVTTTTTATARPRTSRGLASMLSARTDRLRVAQLAPDGGYGNKHYADRAWDDVPAGAPYAVYLVRDGQFYTVALDLDAKPGLDPQRDAARVVALLARARIRFAVAESGPAGGRHIYLTFPDGLDAEIVRTFAKTLQAGIAPSLDVVPLCNPHTGAIRPPGSPHRHGGAVTLITPAEDARKALRAGNDQAALDRLLALLAAPPRQPAAGLQPGNGRAPVFPVRAVPPRYLHLLAHGDSGTEFGDRSSMAAAICLAVLQAGWTRTAFLAAAADRSNVGLAHLHSQHDGHGVYRARTAKEVQAAAGRLWDGRVDYATAHPAHAQDSAARDAVAPLIAAVGNAIGSDPLRWGGQPGPADLAVLRAVLAVVAECGQVTVSASVRQLAEKASVGRTTANSAVRRLLRDGWLLPQDPAVGVHAASYQLSVPTVRRDGAPIVPMCPGGTLDPAPLAGTPVQLTDLQIQSHDVAHPSGLGRTAARILEQATQQPSTATELAQRTGLATRTVRRHLRALSDWELVHRHHGIWSRNAAVTLDDAAGALGVTGVAERRAADHRDERAMYHSLLADQAARRGWTVERGLWVAGRHTLLGRVPRPVPSRPYPRVDGRASFAAADRLHRNGSGADPGSVAATLAHPAA